MTITRNFSVLANGAGSANTLSLGGATLGSNALAVTGTTLYTGAVRVVGGTANGTLVLDKTGATDNRFRMFVGDGSGTTVADDNYISSLNTTLHFLNGAAGTTEAFSITTAGNISFASGSRGIIFNNNSASVNSTLNDYEVGTFTPTFGSTTIGGSYTVNGYYTKVGALVFITVAVGSATSFSSTANSSSMLGLPFTLAGSSAGLSCSNNYIENFGVGAIYSGTTAYLPTISQSGTTKTYFFSGTYRASF